MFYFSWQYNGLVPESKNFTATNADLFLERLMNAFKLHKINFAVSRNYHGYNCSASFAGTYRQFSAAHYVRPITNVRNK